VLLLLVAGGAVGYSRLHMIVSGPEPGKRLRAALRGQEYLGTDGIIFQKGRLDCGPAALAMVFRQYRLDVSLDTLEQQLIDTARGTSMLRMQQVAEKYGFRAEGWRVSAGDLARIPYPSIALYERKHFVVIDSVARDGSLTIRDPSFGRSRVDGGAFLKACNGEVLLLWKLSPGLPRG
jgi:ABC-type bacteriocin/lantibiotic exporter with double-glycine peptidase domain